VRILRLAYVAEFLIALVAAFVLWEEVGGSNHLEMIPWYWKLAIGAGAALAATRATAAAVEGERGWNARSLRWVGILLSLVAAAGVLTYAHHLLETDEEDESGPVSAARVIQPAAWHSGAAAIPTLIVDGRNNHDWRATTPVLKQALEETGLFRVDVATAPGVKGEVGDFRPPFARYRLVVDNYTDYAVGGPWSEATRRDFETYVRQGGGVVLVHAASSAFEGWREFELLAGVAGWAGRDEKTGPMLRWRDGRLVRDTSAGKAGRHGKRHAYQVTIRDSRHPITAGLPRVWMHASDELYERLRGPAQHTRVLATAYAAKEYDGSGEHEPVLLVVRYGQGRVFHHVLGHDAAAMSCLGFLVTFQRGAEWAATGKVTQAPPREFPGPDAPLVRP
jgi:hypothetical protein